jgi:hypothetical protein
MNGYCYLLKSLQEARDIFDLADKYIYQINVSFYLKVPIESAALYQFKNYPVILIYKNNKEIGGAPDIKSTIMVWDEIKNLNKVINFIKYRKFQIHEKESKVFNWVSV